MTRSTNQLLNTYYNKTGRLNEVIKLNEDSSKNENELVGKTIIKADEVDQHLHRLDVIDQSSKEIERLKTELSSLLSEISEIFKKLECEYIIYTQKDDKFEGEMKVSIKNNSILIEKK